MTQEKATNYDGLWGRQIKAEAERRKRMTTPTPTPWEWLPKEGNFIVDANRNIVAEVPCSGGNPADGALIVTAVNERDALLSEVAQLREALEKTWAKAILLVDTAPLCHCAGKQYVDPVALVQRMNAELESARAALLGKER